ncbi:MAG: hypothetical protein RR293_00945 [Bacteroidales bacterium]
MIKNIFVIIMVLAFFADAKAQGWPEASGSRPTFSGFDESSTSTVSDPSGDPVGAESYGKAVGDGDFPETPSNPNPTVPIVESIIGLLGLGGAYAWRLVTKKRKEK